MECQVNASLSCAPVGPGLKSVAFISKGMAAARTGAGMQGLVTCWVGSITASMASHAGAFCLFENTSTVVSQKGK